MDNSTISPVVLIASGCELPEASRVWGTGGWLPPDDREALDWLALARLLGWDVMVARNGDASLGPDIFADARWVIVACDPDQLSDELVQLLETRLASDPLLVVVRAGASDRALARLAGTARRADRIAGRSLSWVGSGPGRGWRLGGSLEATSLELAEDTVTWATLDGAPLIVARHLARGTIATLAFHPSQARDLDGAATALLRNLLIWGVPPPVAWLDLEGTLVLRMDDPGGAQNVHSRGWSYRELGEHEWNGIATELRRRVGRLSIAYISGWVDDGDAHRGSLQVAGQPATRHPARIYPSPLVRYVDQAGYAPGTVHDYQLEYRMIQTLVAAGLADVEAHGYTHMHPDIGAWSRAPDRYDAESWYRECGHEAESAIKALHAAQHPLALAVAAIRRDFGVHPSTVVFPGEQFTSHALVTALDLGFDLVGSYYLGLRDGARLCWAQHVCSPYLDLPDAGWFRSGLPVVGYFHDRDIALYGVGWFSRCLDSWQKAGARRLTDYRELAAALAHGLRIQRRNGYDELVLSCRAGPAPTRAMPIGIRCSADQAPRSLAVTLNGESQLIELGTVDGGLARAEVECRPRSTYRMHPR